MSKNPKERDGGKQDEDLGRKKATADPDNNLSGGAPFDRDEKIEHQREERPEHRRSEGEAHKRWERKPDDLDREDAAIEREGIAGVKPGVRPQGDADFVREKG
jgi:hypothetical protein